MGGMKKKLPWTHRRAVGASQSPGGTALAGFFSKDEILWSATDRRLGPMGGDGFAVEA